MSVALASVATTTFNTQTSITIPAPTGLAIGDILIVQLMPSNNAVITATGFTLLDDVTNTASDHLAVYWKYIGSAPASDYTFGFASSQSGAAALLRVTGGNAAGPFVTSKLARTTSATTIAVPSLTTTRDATLLLGFIGVDRSDGTAVATWSPPGTMSESYDVSDTASTVSAEAASETFATAGATGTRTFTASQTGLSMGLLVAIPPALVVERSAAIAATTAVVAVARRDVLRQAVVSATSLVATVARRDVLRQAVVSSTAAITTAGQRDVLRSSVLSATATVATVGQRDVLRFSALSAATAIDAAGAALRIITAQASLSSNCTIVVAGQRDVLRQAVVTATAAIAASGQRDLLRQAVITAIGAFTVSGQRELHRQAALAAVAEITADGEVSIQLGDGYTDAVVGILTVAPTTGIFTSPANRN